METLQLLLLTLLSVWTCMDTLKLPHYIKPCSRNDPNFNACAKQHAIQAIPQFINGDPKYRVPPLDPILIEELSVSQGSSNFGLSFVARNATLWGLKDVQVKDIRIDLQKQRIEYDLFFPQLDIQFRYNVSGKVLILPITGNGQGSILMKDSSVNIGYNYDRKRKESNGKDYVIPKDLELDFDPKGMTIHLENLFNGDKFLGDNMNSFLNENWKDVLADVGPTIAKAMNQVLSTILTNIFQLVPYDEAFPETV